MDDDRAALLAAGPALDGALVLADAFVPVPSTRGARFARAYAATHGQPPSRFAAAAYETAVGLADAVPAAVRSGNLSGSRLRDALVAGRRFPSSRARSRSATTAGTLLRPLALFRVEANKLSFDGYVDAEDARVSVPPASDRSPPGIGAPLPR